MTKKQIATSISILMSALFLYTGVSKLIDHGIFREEIDLSPILGQFGEFLSWVVPIIEIILSIVLVFPRLRRGGLLFSSILLILFTIYICLNNLYADHADCGCGGFVDKLPWSAHLVFNITMSGLALTGLILTGDKKVNVHNLTTSKR